MSSPSPSTGPSPSRLILAAVALGLIARVAFGVIYWHDKPLTHDEKQYLALATNVIAGRGFVEALPHEPADNAQPFSRAPLYPLFLAPLTLTSPELRDGRLPADVPLAVKLAQSIVGALGVWLIGAITRRIAGDRPAIVAAFIAAVYPPLVWICAYALSEVLYSTLALWCVLVLTRELDRSAESKTASPPASSPPKRFAIFWGRGGLRKAGPGPAAPSPVHSGAATVGGFEGPMKPAIAADVNPSADPRARRAPRVFLGGVLAGLAVLTRPAMLFFLPFELLLAWRRQRMATLWLLTGVTIVVAPWTVRNAIVHHRLVLVAAEGGVTFWTGNHPEAIGEGDLAANPRLGELNREFRRRHANVTEEELESIYYREALGFIASDPIRWLGLEGRKLFYTVVPIGPSYRLHSPRYFWMSVVAYGLILPCAVAGAIRLWRSGRRPWSLWWLAVSAVFVCLAFFPQERFRIPVIDPALIVCAAVWSRP